MEYFILIREIQYLKYDGPWQVSQRPQFRWDAVCSLHRIVGRWACFKQEGAQHVLHKGDRMVPLGQAHDAEVVPPVPR